MLMTLALLWLCWVLAPDLQPVFVILVALWLIGAGWLSTR